ncbi:protein kinase, partial [Gemmatimonadota bacterium]
EDTTLNRPVALKTLSQNLSENEEARERFVREAQSASAINHPNITTVYELVEEDDTRFICMEYVDGKTLRDMVEGSRVPVKQAIDIILQTAEGLEAAHDEGILHRDIKSANIMVNEKGRVKVMDFGLAHLEERSQLTREGSTLGTLAYSSPEQVSGSPVNESSEIFSLGVVFYELLTGQLPFAGSSDAETVLAIISGEQSAVTQFRGDVSDRLEAVVTRMLEKDATRRYQNCGELIGDLKAIQGELETSTIPISRMTASIQGRRKRRIRMIAAGGSVVVVMAALYLLFVAPVRSQIPRIGVLPFHEINPLEDETFSYSLASEIRDRLGRLSGLEVVEFYGSERYHNLETDSQIGKELGVQYLLRVDLREEHTPDNQARIRVSPRLIRVADLGVIPLETTEAVLTGTAVFDLYSAMAEQVAGALGVVLLDEEEEALQVIPTDSPGAYESYRLGRYHLDRRTPDDLPLALAHFQEAVAQDTTFAAAYAGLADTYALWPYYMIPINPIDQAEVYANAKEAARTALRLDPLLAEAHASLGYVLMYADWDWEGAEREFTMALALDPGYPAGHYWYSELLGTVGRFEEALSEARQSVVLDPLSTIGNNFIGVWLITLDQIDEAEAQFRYNLEINPGYPGSHSNLGTLLIKLGRLEEGYDHWLKLGFMPAEFAELAISATRDPARREETCRTFLEEYRWLVLLDPIASAGLFAMWDMDDLAFELLEVGFDQRHISMTLIQHYLRAWDLQSDPRSLDLLERMGLGQYFPDQP